MFSSPEEAVRAQQMHEGKESRIVETSGETTASAVVVDALNSAMMASASTVGQWHQPLSHGWHDGEKFAGGFGATQLLATDYWTLRQRSEQLFKTNIYARGIISRFVTNEINTGLHLEAIPEESILGRAEGDLESWSEEIENRFALWAKTPALCDRRGFETFGAIQAQARTEALISGDCLVVIEQDRRTKLPTVRLYSGACVRTPMDIKAQRGHEIKHGVEVDEVGRHMAYWIRKDDGKAKRLPAFGEKSGRRIAWLVYGTRKRIGEVRGEPLLSAVLQSLREIDRYKDSTQRKALLGSLWLGWIEKEQDKAGSGFMGRSRVSATTRSQTDNTGQHRRFSVAEQVPGMFAQELQHGERVKFQNAVSTDEKFSDFESAILYGIAWSLEVPPEILTLSFNANYSASQAAINEFKMYLDRARVDFADALCAPVYQEWLLSEVLNERVQAQGLLEAWRDPMKSDVFAAWIASDWAGHIKPSTDILKQARGLEFAVGMGLIDLDRATREFSGMKFSKVVKRLKSQVARLKEAGLYPAFVQTAQQAQAPGTAGEDSDGKASASLAQNILRLTEVADELEERVAG